MDTLFAPAEREASGEILEAFASLKAQIPYDEVLALVPSVSLIVDSKRQILYANASAISTLGLRPSDIVGARPGELLGCVHAADMPGGCGASESCRVCGMVGAILESLEGGVKSERECRLTTARAGKASSLDLRVTAVPIPSSRGRLVMVTFVDIGDSKRRQVLERLFFHDLINSLSSLQAGMFLIKREFGSLVGEHDYLARVSATADSLIDEVVQQKELFSLEKGDLEVDCSDIELPSFARAIVRQVEIADYAKGKRIRLDEGPSAFSICSDPTLLRRVLLNMLKNALEASREGEEVAISLAEEGGRARISVRNSAFIPRELQLQVFQRSFSTKGGGRGIGTYSMKVLTEEYLEGEIGFVSGEAEGTTFTLLIPPRTPS